MFTGKHFLHELKGVKYILTGLRSNCSDEAMITWRSETDNIFGSFKFRDGRSFSIERCHRGYVLKRFDLTSFPQEQSFFLSQEQRSSSSLSPTLSSRGNQDNSTLVTFSVMIYYTPQVRKTWRLSF